MVVLAIVLLTLISARDCEAAPYTLTVTGAHGSITVTPGNALYDEGEKVELIPRPETGYCFTGWTGDVHSSRLILNLTMNSNKSITANFGVWTPPIGIPTPGFGIFQTYRMYDEAGRRNPNLTYQASPGGGYYTHYVDNTDPNATDTANPTEPWHRRDARSPER